MAGRPGRESNFPKYATAVHNTGTTIPMFLGLLFLTGAAMWLIWEDFNTSVWGYELLPVNEGFPQTKYVIAALPILFQFVLSYVFLAFAVDRSMQRKQYLLWLLPPFLLVWLVDSVPDIMYRTQQGGMSIFAALLLTILVFTLAAEIILSFALPMLRAMFHYFILDVIVLWAEIRAAFIKGIDVLNELVDRVGKTAPKGRQQSKKGRGNQQANQMPPEFLTQQRSRQQQGKRQ